MHRRFLSLYLQISFIFLYSRFCEFSLLKKENCFQWILSASLYQEPEKAGDEVATTSRKLNEKEARELVKIYESQLRRFRIWARDKLSKWRLKKCNLVIRALPFFVNSSICLILWKVSWVMFLKCLSLRRPKTWSPFHNLCQASGRWGCRRLLWRHKESNVYIRDGRKNW